MELKDIKLKDIKAACSEKIKFSRDEFETLFDYATSVREDTCEWIEKEISYKEWSRRTYVKKTIDLVDYLVNKYGTVEVRRSLCKYMRRWGCDDLERFKS